MDNRIPCTVYIDEAGDLGANRGTQWFVLTAVVVDSEEEPAIRERLDAIKQRLNLRNIHFRTIKDFNKRGYIVSELSNSNFVYVNILFDTTKFDRQRLPSDTLAYNYICRFLLERVSWYLRDTHRIGNIILSSRGTSRDNDLKQYIQDRLIPYAANEIAPVFAQVDCKPASSWDMLQLADICATSMFYSHEINRYGTTTPCFALKLFDKLYRHNNIFKRYGIKYFSDEMIPSRGFLQSHRVCFQKQ